MWGINICTYAWTRGEAFGYRGSQADPCVTRWIFIPGNDYLSLDDGYLMPISAGGPWKPSCSTTCIFFRNTFLFPITMTNQHFSLYGLAYPLVNAQIKWCYADYTHVRIQYINNSLTQWRRNFHYGKSMTISVTNQRAPHLSISMHAPKKLSTKSNVSLMKIPQCCNSFSNCFLHKRFELLLSCMNTSSFSSKWSLNDKAIVIYSMKKVEFTFHTSGNEIV